MFTGRLNSISSYLSQFTGAQITAESEREDSAEGEESTDEIADNAINCADALKKIIELKY